MKTKLIGLVAAAGLATLATGCDNPTEVPSCLVGRGQWIVKYTPDPAFASTDSTSGPCVGQLGSIVNINKYQDFPLPGKPTPIPSLAIKPIEFAGFYGSGTVPTDLSDNGDAQPNETPEQRTDLSFGAFSSVRAQNNLCTVPQLTTAKETDPNDGTVTSFEYSDVTFLNDPAHSGTQMKANLTLSIDTTSTGGGACVAHYTVEGLYSINYGTGQTIGSELSPILTSAFNSAIPPLLWATNAACVTDADCSAFPQGADAFYAPTGSGIAPDYAVHCDVPLGQSLVISDVASPLGVGFETLGGAKGIGIALTADDALIGLLFGIGPNLIPADPTGFGPPWDPSSPDVVNGCSAADGTILKDCVGGQPVGVCFLSKPFPSLCDGPDDPACAIQHPNVGGATPFKPWLDAARAAGF